MLLFRQSKVFFSYNLCAYKKIKTIVRFLLKKTFQKDFLPGFVYCRLEYFLKGFENAVTHDMSHHMSQSQVTLDFRQNDHTCHMSHQYIKKKYISFLIYWCDM